PTATGGAVTALEGLSTRVFARDLVGPAASLAAKAPPYELRVHRRYNPAGETSLNIVPGLMGTILTMTMLIFTALSVTREIERGTMENLLSMPVRPVEIMLGKIIPYLMVGGVQMTVILVTAYLLFGVPVVGSLALLIALTLLFVVANLSIGYTFSTIATNQLQAMQMSFFFFLPSMLLSGFMFPFRGMPVWAQYVGEILPLTHYLRLVRGVMLKGATLADLHVDVLALAAFALAAMGVAVARFRQTLD
ncbi:MAG TPA: ABC transporter permease, partial [Beijerinckiaceae bacterium]|nr:ABC transporter permease [Beijerinckiaceae bacterium]